MAVAERPFPGRPAGWALVALLGMVLPWALPTPSSLSGNLSAGEDSAHAAKEPGEKKAGKREKKSEEEGRFSEDERELKRTVSTGQYDQAAAILDKLATTEEVEAFEILIREALIGADYGLEKYAGELLLRSENPKVRALVFQTLKAKSSNYKTKIILMGVAARLVDDPRALGAIQSALKDPYKPVVLTAVYWLWKLNRAESIEPLISELDVREKKGQERICHDIRRALKSITGSDIELAVDWKGYWDARKQGIAAPTKPAENTTILYKPTFFNIAVNSDRV